MIITPSLTITSDEIRCLPCRHIIPRNSKNSVTNCVAHFQSRGHRTNCLWTLSREQGGFKTIQHHSEIQTALESHLLVPLERPQTPSVTIVTHDDQVPSSSQALSPESSDSEESYDPFSQSPTIHPVQTTSLQATVTTKTASTQLDTQFEERLRSLLSEDAGMELRADFKATDMIRCFQDYPLLKNSVQNTMRRKNYKSWHNKDMKRPCNFQLRVQLIGLGPLAEFLIPQLKKAVKPEILVLPYIDVDNLRKHMLKFKDIIKVQGSMWFK